MQLIHSIQVFYLPQYSIVPPSDNLSEVGLPPPPLRIGPEKALLMRARKFTRQRNALRPSGARGTLASHVSLLLGVQVCSVLSILGRQEVQNGRFGRESAVNQERRKVIMAPPSKRRVPAGRASSWLQATLKRA